MRTTDTLSAPRLCGVLIAIAAATGLAHASVGQGFPSVSTPEPEQKAHGGENCPWTVRSMASSSHTHVAVCHCGKLLASSDGNSWRRVEPDLPTFFRGVTFAHGLFIAVGGSYVDLPGVILTSTDGLIWTKSRGEPNLAMLRRDFGQP